MRALVAAAVVAIAPAAAAAADRDGVYTIHRGRSCWDYLVWKDTRNGTALGLLDAWVAGYLTAYNRQTPETVNILGDTTMEAAMEWLEQWCRANPKSSLDAALTGLTGSLYTRRHKTAKEAPKRH